MLGVLDRVAPWPAVSSVTSTYSPAGSAQISKNATIAYATVTFDAQASNLTKQDITRVMNFAEAAREPGLEVELGGQAIGNAEQPSLGISAGVGILAAALVPFLPFRSLLPIPLPPPLPPSPLPPPLITATLPSPPV